MIKKEKLTVAERQRRWRAQNLERSREMNRVWAAKARSGVAIEPTYKNTPTYFQSIKEQRMEMKRQKQREFQELRRRRVTKATLQSKRRVREWLMKNKESLEAPMIRPALIPDGYQQSFDYREMRYVLVFDPRYNCKVQT